MTVDYAANGTVVRRAEDAPEAMWWATPDGRVFSVHALYTDRKADPILIDSDNKTWPSLRAASLGLDYKFMRNATREECVKFLAAEGIENAKEVRV